MHGLVSWGDIASAGVNHPEFLAQARTMAFVALSFCELIHMIGMSNQNRSFIHVFKNKNWMMLLAFVVGVGLQLLVVEVPLLQQIFSTADLEVGEWLMVAAMSVTPLLMHELVVLFKFIKSKYS